MTIVKQKIILDTNVLVSGLIAKGIPSDIIEELVFEQKIDLCLSQEVKDEYIGVINRDKFTKYENFHVNAKLLINFIINTSTLYRPEMQFDILKDKSDNKFLELSLISNADYIITGNTNDFNITEFGRTKILTPKEYWDNHKPS